MIEDTESVMKQDCAEEVHLLSNHVAVHVKHNVSQRVRDWFRAWGLILEHFTLVLMLFGFLAVLTGHVPTNTASKDIPERSHYFSKRTILFHISILPLTTLGSAPALEAAGPLRSQMTNNSLRQTNKYKGAPSPEIDKAWKELWASKHIKRNYGEVSRLTPPQSDLEG